MKIQEKILYELYYANREMTTRELTELTKLDYVQIKNALSELYNRRLIKKEMIRVPHTYPLKQYLKIQIFKPSLHRVEKIVARLNQEKEHES